MLSRTTVIIFSMAIASSSSVGYLSTYRVRLHQAAAPQPPPAKSPPLA
jgi:hypothetical protein